MTIYEPEVENRKKNHHKQFKDFNSVFFLP